MIVNHQFSYEMSDIRSGQVRNYWRYLRICKP